MRFGVFVVVRVLGVANVTVGLRVKCSRVVEPVVDFFALSDCGFGGVGFL
jgi:hypothetical protein